MALEITAADVTNAEEFLATVVANQLPDGRYTDGTALRDLCIKALAVIAAQLRKENNTTQSLQSLLRIRELARTSTDPAIDDAADAALSNWFITRKTGNFSRGVIQVFVSRKQDYLIARTTRFFYDRTLAFLPDASADVVIPALDVTPILDASGAIVAYSFPLRVIAAKTGTAYNVFPGTWAGTGGFSPFALRVSSSTRFDGGQDRQSTVDMIDQAQDGIAVRNLINVRSINATLTEKFKSLGLSRMTSIGMGEPEMQRDLAVELATNVRLHVGGHFDIYVDLAVANTAFEGILGGVYERPDGIINVFDDTNVPDWTATAVEVGDVIRITAGLPAVPRDFPIKEIRTTELYVSALRAFPEADTNLSYYIYRPLFGPDVQIYPTISVSTTGVTASTVQTVGHLVLPAEPHYDIIDVAVLNPDPGDTYVNDPDGLVHFTSRINDTPVLPSAANISLPFQVIGREPANGQSSLAFDEVVLPTPYNGKRVRVTYQTLASFSAVDRFTRDRYERILAANVQVKGRHPVYLSMRIPYTYSPIARGTVNELSLRQNIVAYIMGFDPRDVIDASDITSYVKRFSSNIGTVYPFAIQYDLLAPNGDVYSFTTNDIVSMDPAKLDPGFNVTLDELLALTISDRTVRYLTRLDRIQVEVR